MLCQTSRYVFAYMPDFVTSPEFVYYKRRKARAGQGQIPGIQTRPAARARAQGGGFVHAPAHAVGPFGVCGFANRQVNRPAKSGIQRLLRQGLHFLRGVGTPSTPAAAARFT